VDNLFSSQELPLMGGDMSRLPTVTRDQLLAEDQAIWDRVMSGRHSSGGPYGALIHAPALAERVSAVENYFRSTAVLPAGDRELVILVTARELQAHFPWSRHEIRGREAGLRSEVIEALRANGSLETLTPRQQLLVEIVRSLLREHRLPDDLFARAYAELGNRQLVETVALVGHYSLIGSVANAFALVAPEGSVTF
jgi:4-carboxymuconolactone decarboxylase